MVREAANVDIESYIDQELAMDPRLKKWDEVTQENIKTVLMKGSQGMCAQLYDIWSIERLGLITLFRFRWVALQLFELKRCSSPYQEVFTLPHTF